MAFNITEQPKARVYTSTLLPIKFNVFNNFGPVVNIVARCYCVNQLTGAETQVGGEYRCAPRLSSVDNFAFDASEIFNTKTKYTLVNWPTGFKFGSAYPSALDAGTYWRDVATYSVFVRFYQEVLNATTGLIEVDYSVFEQSNTFFIHEGCPEIPYLQQVAESNGFHPFYNVFTSFRTFFGGGNFNRYLTTYPITKDGAGRTFSKVTIHENERYLLSTLVKDLGSLYSYKIGINTFQNGNLLNQHTFIELLAPILITENLFTFDVGFQTIKETLTANGPEGTNFENVTNYRVTFSLCTSATACGAAMTIYDFKVKRGCVGDGYLRFAFKNMLGAYDLVSSYGSFIEKNKIEVNQYTKTLGYHDWNDSDEYGSINYQADQTKIISVTTHPMKINKAEHFAGMFQSTSVYLRHKNDAADIVNYSQFDTDQRKEPYAFQSIRIVPGSFEIQRSTNGFAKLKFSFEKSVNQRTPRM